VTACSLADLTSPRLAELLADPRTPVTLLPVGAVEPHGPHAPLGTDGIISAGICRRAAESLADDRDVRPLVLPLLPYGVTRYAAAFPGAIGVGEDTLHALVVDVCGSLAEQGLRHHAIVNSHFEPEQVTTLRRAVDTLRERGDARVGLLDLTRRRHAERLTPEFRDGSCHAGRYETSLVLADAPSLVDRERMRALPAVPVDMPAAIAAGCTDFVAMGMDAAYCGAPAEATAEEGEATFATLTEILIELVRELVRE
jgi:creatinine amidohydrolase